MGRLRIVMAVSQDGYMAREAGDDMSWLGSTDKAVFRVLTGVGGIVLVGPRTRECMPDILSGRRLLTIQRKGLSLGNAAATFPGAWLAGGPTLALAAIRLPGMVGEVHLCRSDRMAFPSRDGVGALKDVLTHVLLEDPRWSVSLVTKIGDVTLESWRHGDGA